MEGNTYSNNNHQKVNGYNGGYPMGYQRMGHKDPLLGMGGQYGIVQDGNQGWPLMAAGSGGNIPASN